MTKQLVAAPTSRYQACRGRLDLGSPRHFGTGGNQRPAYKRVRELGGGCHERDAQVQNPVVAAEHDGVNVRPSAALICGRIMPSAGQRVSRQTSVSCDNPDPVIDGFDAPSPGTYPQLWSDCRVAAAVAEEGEAQLKTPMPEGVIRSICCGTTPSLKGSEDCGTGPKQGHRGL